MIPVYREHTDKVIGYMKKDKSGNYCLDERLREDLYKPPSETFYGCSGCGKLSTDIKSFQRCSRCKKFLYCNNECQKKGWKAHKLVCV
jgi:hypothetical protein